MRMGSTGRCGEAASSARRLLIEVSSCHNCGCWTGCRDVYLFSDYTGGTGVVVDLVVAGKNTMAFVIVLVCRCMCRAVACCASGAYVPGTSSHRAKATAGGRRLD